MRTFLRNYFKFGLVVEEILFKDISIFSSCDHFVQWSRMICAILVENKNITKNIFLILALVAFLFSKVNTLGNFE